MRRKWKWMGKWKWKWMGSRRRNWQWKWMARAARSSSWRTQVATHTSRPDSTWLPKRYFRQHRRQAATKATTARETTTNKSVTMGDDALGEKLTSFLKELLCSFILFSIFKRFILASFQSYQNAIFDLPTPPFLPVHAAFRDLIAMCGPRSAFALCMN